MVLHFSNLSCGRQASVTQVSSSIPAKDKTVLGPTFFSGAIGTPKSGGI